MPAPTLSPAASAALSFTANISLGYVFSRFNGQDGPRLQNLAADGGDYGIPMARGFGDKVRVTGSFIAQANIKEKKHKIGSKALAIIGGAIGGAATGFSIGGPVGAAVGAVIGGLLGFASPNHYYYTYSDTIALLLLDRTNDDPIEGVLKLWANGKKVFDTAESSVVSQTFGTDGKLISRKYGKNKYIKSLTIYAGHSDQGVDPILAGIPEIAEDGGYPFSAYIVIEDFQLAAFGNSVPPVEALVQVKASETFAGAAETICAAAGIDRTRNVSTTAIASDPLRGYLIASETTCWDGVKALLPVFKADAAEVSGQVRFYKRYQIMQATITADDMGGHAYGDTPPQRYRFKSASELDLPQETSVTFVDPARDYLSNTATSSRTEGNAKSNVTVQLTVVLTASEGASTAALMHWDAWLGRTELAFNLIDAWSGIATGRAYGIPVGGQIVPYRLIRRLRGANGVIEVDAVSDEQVTYTAVITGTSGEPPPENSTLFENTRLILIDGPIISDDHDEYGYYIAMAGDGPDWERGAIQVSSNGVDFVTIIDQPVSATMGDVVGTLAAGTTDGLDDTLDTTTVLTVDLLHSGMTLEDATDAELDAWVNFAFVGKDGIGEYLQWKTATQTGQTTWELTNLRRGRRGTDWAIGTHTSGEEFALLGEDGVFRIVYSDTSKWGEEFDYRGVTLHQDEDDAAIQSFTNTGEGKRPFSPIEVEGSWDGSNNATLDCTARSRLFAGGLGIDDLNDTEWVITNATPDRTITVTGGTAASYTAAQQAADGLTVGGVIIGRVRRLSDVNDGRWRDFTLYGPATRTADSTVWTADTTLITADMG